MNIKFNYLILLAIVIAAVSCKKDNYAEPTSTISGRLTYNGDSVGVEYNAVPFLIYQSGYKTIKAITGTFADDGSFSVLTFDGDYKFTMAANQGPFRWKELSAGARDTLRFKLTGNQTMNIEVTPYYMIRSLKTSVVGTTRVVSANFNIEQIITDPALAKSIERVTLFINKTNHVSNAGSESAATGTVTGGALPGLTNITLNATMPAFVPTQNYVFARVGVKITGVEDWIYSPVRKMSF